MAKPFFSVFTGFENSPKLFKVKKLKTYKTSPTGSYQRRELVLEAGETQFQVPDEIAEKISGLDGGHEDAFVVAFSNSPPTVAVVQSQEIIEFELKPK